VKVLEKARPLLWNALVSELETGRLTVITRTGDLLAQIAEGAVAVPDLILGDDVIT